MGFYGSLSRFEEKTLPAQDVTKCASAKILRRMLLQNFQFLEAARIRSGLYEGAYLNVDDFTTKTSFKDLIVENPDAVVNFSAFTNRPAVKGLDDSSSDEESDMDMLMDEIQKARKKMQYYDDVGTKRFLTRMSVWPPFSIWAGWILRSRPFEIFMIGVIVINSLVMCVEGELLDKSNLRIYATILDAVDFFFLLLFIMEISLKWTDNFRQFWNEYWNWFDFVVTAASVLAPVLDVVNPDSSEDENLREYVAIIKYIRIARILRALNVVTRIHKIMVIWGAITRTFTALVFIIILMLLFFYIFAIIGIQLCQRFTKTHRTNLRYVDRFSLLPYAFLTLFQIFTIDHWHPILVELMEVMSGEIACCFILIWLLLGTFIFKNIFAGVMVNSFQNIRQELVDETNEITNKARLAGEYEMMEIEKLEAQILRTDDTSKDWETKVFHHLDLIKACNGDLSLSLWPRDTLFHYYVMLEALAKNIAERDEILYILNQSLLQQYIA